MRLALRLLCTGTMLWLPALAMTQQVPSVPQVAMKDGDHMLRAFRNLVLLDTLAIWQDVPLNPRRAYARVREVLEALKIPIANADSVGGVLSNTAFVPRGRQFAGKANSAWLRCGFGPTGDHADQWRVTVAYAAYVRPHSDGAGSQVGIALMGQARDIAGANSPPVFCNTKGSFEAELIKLVRVDPQSGPVPDRR